MHLSQLAPAARNVVENVLAVKPGEVVLVLTDYDCSPAITNILAAAIKAHGAKPLVMMMEPHPVGGVEPIPAVGAAIQSCSAVINQSSYALTHTETMRQAYAKGIRLCDMWGCTEDIMVYGGIAADYQKIAERTQDLLLKLQDAKEIVLTTPEGTELFIDVSGRKFVGLTGTAREPGQFAALPDGEVAVAPREKTAYGIIRDPYLLEQKEIGFRRDPLVIKICDGEVESIEGGREARRLRELIEEHGPTARNFAEFAIGTNDRSRIGSSIRECKKALGTAHVAIGDNRSLGGEVNGTIHMDIIFLSPTVLVDGREIMKDGQLKV